MHTIRCNKERELECDNYIKSKKNLQFLFLVGPHSSFSSGEMTKANCKFKLEFI